MLKTIMVLPDGTEIRSGAGTASAIKSCTVTASVNNGEELTPGSCCAACAELTVITAGALLITGGTEFTLYKQDDSGTRHRIGVFTAEKPARSSAQLYKITAYDNVARLDKDLSDGIVEVSRIWSQDPAYTFNLDAFARYVCVSCGVELASTDFPNADLSVYCFDIAGCTGRQIMQWLGECIGCYCKADAEGKIVFDQFGGEPVATLRRTGDRYYYTLSYEDYTVPAIDGVHFYVQGTYYKASDVLYKSTAANPFVIPRDNRVWYPIGAENQGGDKTNAIYEQLTAIGAYRPCKVSIPACVDIHAGNIVTVVTPEGEELRMLVMTKISAGQRDTLECTGSVGRSSSTAVNHCSSAKAASQAVGSLTQQDILDKLGARWLSVDGIGQVLVKKESST